MRTELTERAAAAVKELDHADRSLPRETRKHLGALLASVYARADHDEPDAIARFADLLAKLDAVLGQVRDRGDAEFRQLLLASTPALRRFALSLTHDPASADDLVQETLMRAWKNRTHFALGTNFEAWSFTIMRNQFYTDCRKRREVRDEEGTFTARLIALPDQAVCLDFRDVQAALAQLKPPMREALMLVTVEGLTYEDAAAVIDCQIGTVKSRVSRAREQLVQMLGYVGGEIGNDAVMLSASSQATTS